MEISGTTVAVHQLSSQGLDNLLHQAQRQPKPVLDEGGSEELRGQFQKFVAGTFFRTLLRSLRNTVPEQSLMDGGRAEKIFREQLDQTLAEEMAGSHGAGVADEMFRQFQLLTGGATATTAPEVSTSDERRPDRTTLDATAIDPG